ncbi:MAG: hypothetical protein NPIRA01_20640 [Nitrospirales bacterium]|nr:MAG: hypothetical protein NPIRA01_20640 [Nitrospirales bacterium]
MESKEDIAKIRRFSLGVGIILFLYSIGVEIDTSTAVPLFGLPLKIKYSWLIGLGLVLTSLYSTTRYWYHVLFKVDTPIKERLAIVRGEIPDSMLKKFQSILLAEYYKKDHQLNEYVPLYQDLEPKFLSKTRIEQLVKLFNICAPRLDIEAQEHLIRIFHEDMIHEYVKPPPSDMICQSRYLYLYEAQTIPEIARVELMLKFKPTPGFRSPRPIYWEIFDFYFPILLNSVAITVFLVTIYISSL